MPLQKVMLLMEYDAPTPEDAERDLREAEARYEAPARVVAAASWAELPHATQLDGISDDE